MQNPNIFGGSKKKWHCKGVKLYMITICVNFVCVDQRALKFQYECLSKSTLINAPFLAFTMTFKDYDSYRIQTKNLFF